MICNESEDKWAAYLRNTCPACGLVTVVDDVCTLSSCGTRKSAYHARRPWELRKETEPGTIADTVNAKAETELSTTSPGASPGELTEVGKVADVGVVPDVAQKEADVSAALPEPPPQVRTGADTGAAAREPFVPASMLKHTVPEKKTRKKKEDRQGKLW